MRPAAPEPRGRWRESFGATGIRAMPRSTLGGAAPARADSLEVTARARLRRPWAAVGTLRAEGRRARGPAHRRLSGLIGIHSRPAAGAPRIAARPRAGRSRPRARSHEALR